MGLPKCRSLLLATVVAAAVLAIPGVAHAAGTLSVTPSTSLTDGQDVAVQLGGFTPGPLASLQIAECGNAYADGTPLASMPAITPGVLDPVNCEVVRFVSPGQVTADPLVVSNVPVSQVGIGTGNRSCVSSPPAVADCFVYISTSVNLPTFPTAPISFAGAPPTTTPAPTSTVVAPVGMPIGSGKVAHAIVTVTASDPAFRPEGSVEVFEGSTSLGTGVLGSGGTADVALGTPALGSHTITAAYYGTGSFAGSNSGTAQLSVIDARNISVGDASIVEGDGPGTRTVVFPVVLSKLSPVNVTVNYTVVPSGVDAASIPGDVNAVSGTLTFVANKHTVKYVNVKVVGDTTPENDETFSVQLSNPNTASSGYVLRRPTGSGVIYDDDSTVASPNVQVGGASVPEGDNGGPRQMKFTVTLSSAQATDVVVKLQLSSLSATHGTKATGDWGGAINRSLKLKAHTLSKTINVAAFADSNHELDETVRVALLTVSPGVSLGTRSVAIGTILSDE
jgi:hypothetical protein